MCTKHKRIQLPNVQDGRRNVTVLINENNGTKMPTFIYFQACDPL